jgi:hypothetical protein
VGLTCLSIRFQSLAQKCSSLAQKCMLMLFVGKCGIQQLDGFRWLPLLLPVMGLAWNLQRTYCCTGQSVGLPEDHFVVPPTFIGIADIFFCMRDKEKFDDEVHKILARTVSRSVCVLFTLLPFAIFPAPHLAGKTPARRWGYSGDTAAK